MAVTNGGSLAKYIKHVLGQNVKHVLYTQVDIRGNKMKRQKCEVFSRSMGYIRPIKNFNIGKRAEFEERNTFKENIIFRTINKLLKRDAK
jgi:hypothetical protein